MVHATCAALHCLSSSNIDKDLKFHQFPHDAERRKIWINACRRSDVIDKDWDFFKHKYVCSMHFQKSIYTKKGHLRKSAIPSLHLSEKPLQYDSSTQTVESVQYVNQKSENDVHTQTECSLPYDIKQVNIKEEIINKIEEFEAVVQDVEMETENDNDDDDHDAKNSDSGPFGEDVEIKTEIVENEILPLVLAMHSLQSVDLEIIKDGGTLSTQAKNLLQKIDQGLTAPIVNRTSTNPINTITMPILKKRKMGESIQTDRVMVLSQNADGSEGPINPEECICDRKDYVDMNRPQFCRACSKYLSANLAIPVRKRMLLDDVIKHGGNQLSLAGGSGRVKAGGAECVKLAGCEGLAAPDVVIAGTETAADSAVAELYAVDRDEAMAAASAADCAQSRRYHRVSLHQLEILWYFLNSNRAIATTHNRDLQANEDLQTKWREIAEILNSQVDGAHKDWADWSKYWVVYMAKLKKRFAAIRASRVRTGGGPSTGKPLTKIEEKYLLILEEDLDQVTSGVGVEPPPEIVTTAADVVVQDSPVSESILHNTQSVLDPPFLTPIQDLPVEPISEPLPQNLPLELMVQDPPASSPNRTPATTSAARPRRRSRRRKPPMSQEAARLALARSTKMHARAAARTAEAMEKIVLKFEKFQKTATRIERILNAAFPSVAEQLNSQ